MKNGIHIEIAKKNCIIKSNERRNLPFLHLKALVGIVLEFISLQKGKPLPPVVTDRSCTAMCTKSKISLTLQRW